MKRTFKQILCLLLVAVMLLCAAPLDGVAEIDFAMRVSAASNIVINGIDIGYANGSYFTKDGKSCATNDFSNGRCHKNNICTKATDSRCNCMRYWPSYPNYQVDLMASQCFGFARYCQWRVYGYHDGNSTSKFTNLTGTISSSNCTASNLKNKLLGCSPATHIRTGDGEHSISIISVDDNNVKVADCNSNGYCLVKTYSYTWSTFASYLKGRDGISYAYSAKSATTNPPVVSKPEITSAKGDSHTEISIKWIEVETATKYKVERRMAGEDDYVVAKSSTTATSFTDSGLATGKRYYYKVTAYKDSTKLGTSEAVGVYTKFNEPEISTVSDSKLKISWKSVSKAESYTVMRRKAGDDAYSEIKTVTETSYTDSGLSASTQYYYWVKANCNVDGTEIIAKSTSAGQYTLTKAPVIKNVNDISKSEIEITWNDVTGAQSYRIERRKAGDSEYKTLKSGLTSTTYNDSGLETGQRYYYIVYAKNSAGESSASTAVGGYTKYNAPTVITDSTSQLKLTWDSVAKAESYTIKRRIYNGEYSDIKTVTGTSYTDSGLQSGTQYYYWIQANCNIDGTSMVAKSESKGQYTKLATPKSSEIRSTSLKISWNSMKGSDTYKYAIQRKLSAESSYKTISTITGNSYTDNNLSPSTTYNYRIQVLNNDGKTCATTDKVDVKTADCPHSYTAIVTTVATCKNEGIKTFTCSKCGSSYTEEIAKNANNHTGGTEIRNDKISTCTAEGYTGDTYCKGCGVKTKSGTSISKKSHSYVDSIIKDATCTENGTKLYKCNCGASYTEIISKKAHIETKVEEKKATCTENGYTAGTYCNDCETWLSGHEVITSEGHSWQSATCTVTKKCSVCGTTEGSVLSHKDDNGDYKCDYNCGYEYEKPTTVPTTQTPVVTEPTKAPVETTTKPVVETTVTTTAPSTESTTVPTTAPTTQPTTAKPVETTKPIATEPTTVPTTTPTTQAPAVTQPTTQAPVETTAQTPAEKPTEAPAVKPTEEPATVPVTQAPTTTKPVETTAIPTTVPSTEQVTKPTEVPTTVPSTEPATTPSEESTTVHTHIEEVIPAVPATYTKTGLTEGKKCSSCGEILVEQKIVARKKLKKVVSLKAKKTTANSVTLTWKKAEGADSYKVYYSTNGKKWKSVKVKKNTATIKKLSTAKNYQFKVRAYAGKYYGDASKVVKTTTKFTTAKLSNVKSTKKATALVTWKKVTDASGYIVEYSTSKKFTKKTTKKVTIKKGKTTKTTLKKLKSGKKYYVRIKSYKTVNKKTVYGAYSSVKTVKIK